MALFAKAINAEFDEVHGFQGREVVSTISIAEPLTRLTDERVAEILPLWVGQ